MQVQVLNQHGKFIQTETCPDEYTEQDVRQLAETSFGNVKEVYVGFWQAVPYAKVWLH
jgi:hypothetical protein